MEMHVAMLLLWRKSEKSYPSTKTWHPAQVLLDNQLHSAINSTILWEMCATMPVLVIPESMPVLEMNVETRVVTPLVMPKVMPEVMPEVTHEVMPAVMPVVMTVLMPVVMPLGKHARMLAEMHVETQDALPLLCQSHVGVMLIVLSPGLTTRVVTGEVKELTTMWP